MASQYSHPSSLVLPPGCSHNPVEYQLSLTQASLQLIQITPKPTRLKIQMWGLPQQTYLDENTPLCFDIHTSSNMLGQYLRDMKVTVVKMCDSRNNEELGSGLINWAMFLRKLDNNKSPFLLNSFDITVMVFNYKKKQIAEVILQASWAACKKNQRKSLLEENSEKCQQNQPAQIDLNQHLIKLIGGQQNARNQQRINKRFSSDIKQPAEKYNQQIQQQRQLDYGRKQSRQGRGKQFLKHMEQIEPEVKQYIRYPDSRYELQKARLKLEAEQLLTLTKKDYKPKENALQNFITIRIDDLALLKSNIPTQYMDISVVKKQVKNRDNNKQTEALNRRCIRAFPFGKSNCFSVEIAAKFDEIIEVQLDKGGKAIFQVKSIQEKGAMKINIFSKNGKIGTLSATKLYEPSLSMPKQQKTLEKKQRQRQKNKIERQVEQPTISYAPAQLSTFMLIRILDAYHNYLPEFEVVAKSYSINKPYPNFSIIPINELGTIFAIQIRNTKNQTVDSYFIEGYSKIPVSAEGLGCVVVKSGHFALENGWLKAQLMIGTLKQVNYELSRQNRYKNSMPIQQDTYTINKENNKEESKFEKSKYKQKRKQQKQSDEAQEYEIKTKKQSMSSEKVKDDIEVPFRKHKRNNRKIYTQMLGMNESAAIQPSQYNRMQDNEGNKQNQENESVFLVEVLSRFLHALPMDRVSQIPPTSVQQFLSLLNHLLGNREQKYLIDMVTDMFVDDAVEQGQPSRLEYEEFLKCCKSYHNFLQLWWRMRIDVLNQLIKCQPNYEDKINRYSELGTISKEALWKKVFSKIDSSELKLTIDKALRLNAGSTISSPFVIEELRKVQNHSNQLPKQAYPDLIVDLGKLIKQTIQSILEGSGLMPPAVPEDKVNIRVMCDTLNKINICLSYWQALMLIEELKGWYNIDLECNEGIVSGSVVEIWLKSVLNRSGISVKAEEPKQPEIKTLVNNKPEPVLQLSSNPSQKLSKPMQNKSVAKSQLNQEQIENIANLLRDNDNFRMGTFTSQKPLSKVYENSANIVYNISNKSNMGRDQNINKILNDDILDKSSMQESASQESIPRKQPQPTKYLHISIKSIKLRNPSILPCPFKLQLKIQPQAEHYFLCKSIDQVLNRELVEEIASNWHHKSKGLAIQFVNIDQEKGDETTMLYGMLVNDEIIELGKEKKNKTIVVYGNKEIVGKITLQLSLSLQKPQIFYSEKSTSIRLQIAPDSQHEKQWQTYTVRTKANLPSTSSSPSAVEIKAEKHTKYDIGVSGTFYKQILNVIVDGVGSCTVPLEQLYFKHQMEGEYPVVTDEGLFIGKLLITLWNTNGLMSNQNNVMLQKQVKPNLPPNSPVTKYLIMLDSISTINFTALNSTKSSLSMSCNIFIKDAYNRTILYRSPFYVEHEHRNTTQFAITYLSEFSAQNYFIMEEGPKDKVITIQLEYDGRSVGIGDQVVRLRDLTDKNSGSRIMYSLKYAGKAKGDISLAIGIRLVRIPETFNKYNANRIYKAFCKQKFNVEPSLSDYADRLIENNPKLTMTQKKLTHQLAESPGSIYVLYPITKIDYDQLATELLEADHHHSGHLSLSQIQQIMYHVLGEKGKDVMKYMKANFESASKDRFNYMSLLQFTRPSEQVGVSKWASQIGSGVAESICRLHQEIKSKYAVGG